MALSAAAASANVPSLPAERFFRGSLLLLILVAIVTLVATGKLDSVSCTLALLAIAYKGFRWLGRKPPELSQRTATLSVAGYVVFFPLDILFFSRALTATSSNPALYAALLGAVHFLLFVMLVRLYSATTDRDAFFLAMLSFAAILAGRISNFCSTSMPNSPPRSTSGRSSCAPKAPCSPRSPTPFSFRVR